MFAATDYASRMALDRFNLNLFFSLDAILNSETLTEAARKCHLTQPAMSVALKKLRVIFDNELVIYRGGEARLTALAVALKPRAGQIIQSAHEIVSLSPSFDPGTDDSTVRIAAPDVVEFTIFGPLLARIATIAPNVTVVSMPFDFQTVDGLFRQPLDLAIVGESFASKGFASEYLFSETMSCMVWRDGRYGAGITARDYREGRHVGINHANEPPSHPVGTALAKLSGDQRIVARASSYLGLPNAIIGSDLIATTLTSYANICAQMLPVAVFAVPVETPAINFVAQWQPYRQSEPIIQWLLEQVRAVVRAR